MIKPTQKKQTGGEMTTQPQQKQTLRAEKGNMTKQIQTVREEEIYMPEQLPENNKPDNRPVKSALHGKIREQFYKDFYVCVPAPNHYPEDCICEFTEVQIEPVIEWFADFLAQAQQEAVKRERERILEIVKNINTAVGAVPLVKNLIWELSEKRNCTYPGCKETFLSSEAHVKDYPEYCSEHAALMEM